FEEERELTAILLVDVSASDNFGTTEKLKRNLITELSAVLAFSALQNNDKVGVIFFSDKVELFIPPKKGKSHILRVIREMINFQATGKGTNIAEALVFLNRAIKKRCIAFLISDFIDHGNYRDNLRIANKKHDLVAFHVYDEREQEMPDVGLVKFLDAESGVYQWVNTSDKKVRQTYRANALRQKDLVHTSLKKSGVDFTSIGTHENFVKPLMNLFKKRGK
ncbi:MAG: VWA domain-containing protein, partial [Bacteroidota bacterium]